MKKKTGHTSPDAGAGDRVVIEPEAVRRVIA
jgi:hypothetical protein